MNVEKKILQSKFFFYNVFFIIILFLSACVSKPDDVPAAVKNLEKFKFATIEHPNITAPSFTLIDNKNNKISNEALKGKMYIVQGFAPGCSSCAQEISTLNGIYNKYHSKGLEIISLDVASSDISGALETKEKFNGGDWHWAIDTDDVAIKFRIATLESTYLIDQHGLIRYKDESLSNFDVISKEIEKLEGQNG